MTRARSWIAIATAALALPAAASAAVCSSIGTTVVLVDRTVADRAALAAETKSVFDRMLEEAWNKGESYFGSTVELAYLDDQGEHASAWQVRLPKHYGMQKSEMKAGMAILAQKIRSSLEEIRADKKQYSSSMLLEGVSKQLNALGACDRLVVVSDLCVVDKSGNNFERLVFNDPKRLSRKATVELRRIGRPKQSLEAIQLIEAWWQDALYGDGQFRKLFTEIEASMKPGAKPKVAAPRAKATPKPVSQAEQASAELARVNEARIVSDIAKLRVCLDPAGLPKSELGSYRFKIFIDNSGKAAKIEPMEGVSKKIKGCLTDALKGLEYAPHPATDSYFFYQSIEVGNYQG